MYQTIQTEIIKTHTAELHRQARLARLAQVTRQDRRALRPHGTPRVLAGLRPWRVVYRPAI